MEEISLIERVERLDRPTHCRRQMDGIGPLRKSRMFTAKLPGQLGHFDVDWDQFDEVLLEHLLDLIEISPSAVPPIAKIMDYGKFQYDEKKKQKAAANA